MAGKVDLEASDLPVPPHGVHTVTNAQQACYLSDHRLHETRQDGAGKEVPYNDGPVCGLVVRMERKQK